MCGERGYVSVETERERERERERDLLEVCMCGERRGEVYCMRGTGALSRLKERNRGRLIDHVFSQYINTYKHTYKHTNKHLFEHT